MGVGETQSVHNGYIAGPKSSGFGRHRRYKFFCQREILPDNRKAMPAEEASTNAQTGANER
jgi:hypothetical protein